MKTTLITIIGFVILSLIYVYTAEKANAIVLCAMGIIAYVFFLIFDPFKELKHN
jgi:preprotein translocase subunit Sss1